MLLIVITLIFVALTSAHAMSPRIVDPVRSGQAEKDARQMTNSPGVLDAMADENNTLAYVRVKARYEAHSKDDKQRCTMCRGKAIDVTGDRR